MTINCKGELIDLTKPKIMGIINLTPDSFFDGGKLNHTDAVLRQAEKMLRDGATFLDLGAASSKPNAEVVSVEEEKKRLYPALKAIMTQFPDTLISIDTVHANIAKESVEMGAAMINDISGGLTDVNMLETIGKLRVPYICMHMQGNPQTMQEKPIYDDVTFEVNQFFAKRIKEILTHGVNDIILDPGFGFGKTITHNYEMLQKSEVFHFHNRPLLMGISRKSMIYKLLNTSPKEALNGTTALHTLGLLKGYHILRVHDVKEAQEVVSLVGEYENTSAL